ncbi:hypothetical protein [Mesorhizobium sp. RMAD-H1]|uniref:hypothetical protein n=1 Tax=Mesorhizobium sp. RMAD-H1 TaxID=2587065 RepID=UPI001611D064|nr:hypothetical protein [Mesorhizobium sp. RMAD-H1]MBB2973939.1 hypothetical protein [Mesorhizobium sp. RMAD-H1]
MVQTANEIWRDFVTDGVPSSGVWDPDKVDIREWGTYVEQLYAAAQAGGGIVFQTRAAMNANLNYAANQIAWVVADATAANNGIYQKQGASGTGSWVRVADLPYSFIRATNTGAGTANAIQATTPIPIPAADGGALISLPIVANISSSPVTVSFNGEPVLIIKRADGGDVIPGDLKNGMIVAGYRIGGLFRLLNNFESQFIVATNTGGTNAITATTPTGIPAQDGAAFIALPILVENTQDAPTVVFNGDGNVLTITDAGGSPVSAGGLTAGMLASGYKVGSTFRIILGPRGWSPLWRIISNGTRRVVEVYDYVGGQGAKPTATGYVTSTGYSSNIADGVDIRGPAGPNGPGTGDMLKAVYDPTAVEGDAFDLSKHHGTLPAASVDDAALANPSRIYNRISQITYAEDLGVSPSATPAQNSQRVYDAMGEIKTKFGSGTLILGHGHYVFDPSPDQAIYDNFGYQIAGSEGAIIVPTGISIKGTTRKSTLISASDPGLTVMFAISPDGQTFSDFSLDNQWDLVSASNGHGIMNLTPSDSGRPNLLAPGTFDSGTEGWAISGDATISNVSGRLRITHNASVAAVGKISKAFTTVVGRAYRVRVDAYEDTVPVDTLEMAVGPDPSYDARTRIARFRLLYKTPRVFTFIATSTVTYLSVYCTAPVGALGNTHWEMDNVYVCDFPYEDQALWCRNTTFERLNLGNVSSYAIGLENGDIINTNLRDIHIYNTGADGIDSKQRGPSQRNDGLYFSGILVENFGLRLTGSAGIDCHGRAFLDDVIARNFGAPGMVMEGFRLRTMSPPNPSALYVGFEGEQARGSTISNFVCEGNGMGGCVAIAVGSPDCVVTNGMVRNVKNGVSFQGNTSGTAERYKVSNVTAVDCTEYGVVNGVGVNGGTMENVTTISCGVAGIRNVAENTRLINCNDYGSTTGKSTSSGAASTEITIACNFGGEIGITQTSPVAGRIDSVPVGPSANIEHRLWGKGTGPVGFGSPVRFPSYTTTTLPSASTYNGCTVRVTNGSGGKPLVTSNGANWIYADGTAV